MARPVLTTPTSALSFVQWQAAFYQPDASNSPTSWRSVGLPPGFVQDTATGTITGTCEAAGVANVRLFASNADGESDPLLVAMGVRESSASSGTDIDLRWDLVTREVELAGATIALVADAGPQPLLKARYKDVVIFSVQVKKSGVVLDVTPSAFNFDLKADDGEPLIASSGAFHKYGSGSNARYCCALRLEGTALLAAVIDGIAVEDRRIDSKSGVEEITTIKKLLLAIAELEIVFPNPHVADFPDEPNLRFGSDTFRMEVSRNIVP